MKGLRQLEQAGPDESQIATPTRGVAVGIALAGLLILVTGAVYTYWIYSWKPRLIAIDQMPPYQYWAMWEDLRTGVRLPEYSDNPYLKLMKVYRQYISVGIGIMVLGILTLVCSAIVAYATRAPQRRRMPPRAP
jgi:hypothetical protein